MEKYFPRSTAAAVGVFFFYTGCNRIAVYISRGVEWKKGFRRKKLLGIDLPFIICNISTELKIGSYDAPRIIYIALGGYLMNPDTWYIQNCMLVYFVSVFAASFLPGRFTEKIVKLGNSAMKT